MNVQRHWPLLWYHWLKMKNGRWKALKCVLLCPRRCRGGTLCVAFVCSSVCPSVLSLPCVSNYSRTKKCRKPKISKKVAHHTCNLRTSFKVKVTRPIDANTQNTPYLPNSKSYEIRTWYTDGTWRPAPPTSAMNSKIKGQSHKFLSSLCLICTCC